MDYGNAKMQNFLIGKIAEEFARSVRLIENLPDEIYAKIGGHFRHNLDFVCQFLNGLESGKIDYAKRTRNPQIEQNRAFAIEQTGVLISRLQNLPDEMLSQKVEICSEIDATVRHASSVMRELEFLLSHTVHHHAIIAEKLGVFGINISNDFGVAPSTLKFWKERTKAA
jgi:hypothetical protein